MVTSCKIVSIKSTESLPGLVGFDPSAEYSKDNSRFKEFHLEANEFQNKE